MAREKATSNKTAKAKAAELLAQISNHPSPDDDETRKTRLKTLIKLGKERGFLTYAEVNDHLPDDVVDAEQIESIISTFNDMGIQVYDEAPDAETLLMSDAAVPVAADDADVEEQAEQALSTVDSEFGRTTDPVRMYMREMGSVELLTREGEIEIAKRIEDGLRHMIQAISACPTTIAEIVHCADKIASDEMRIDELIDGLVNHDDDEIIEELAEDINQVKVAAHQRLDFILQAVAVLGLQVRPNNLQHLRAQHANLRAGTALVRPGLAVIEVLELVVIRLKVLRKSDRIAPGAAEIAGQV